jgi:hypothetical protein
LGNSVPDTPLLFLKPATAYIHEGQKIKVVIVFHWNEGMAAWGVFYLKQERQIVST